ncbi:lipoprotein [Streptomyces lunalinharesii]|uniref:Lipoprotein n=1 Tax=Streptomyces lunalinharesii TaxID=333384 RepID=A0ABP6E0Q7_9ACTN
MPSQMRRRTAGVLGVALLAGAALGCARDDGERVASMGSARSACELPVTFDVGGPWKAKPLEPIDSGTKKWFHFSHACKLELGAGKEMVELTVDVDDLKGNNPREVLGGHDGEHISSHGEYTHDEHINEQATVAKQPAAEMEYRINPPADIPDMWVRKLAVVAPKGTIVVEVQSNDPGGKERTRQVYDQLKSSMRVAS